MRRRLAVVLAVFLAVPALALASHNEPKRQINAADQRKAASIVLKRTDFATGWKKVPSTPDDPEDSHLGCPGYNPNESDLVLTGEAESDFERADGLPSVSSYSNVYKTTANAVASWTRAVKPALATCLAKLLKGTLEGEGAKVAVVSSGRIAYPKLAPRTAAFRVVLKLTVTENGQTSSVPFTMHIVGLGRGRGDVGLLAMGFGNGMPTADLRAFGKVLAQRLAAAKL